VQFGHHLVVRFRRHPMVQFRPAIDTCAGAAAGGSERPGLRTRVAVACRICGTERPVRPSVLALGGGLYCSRACANIGKRSPGRGLRDPAAWVSSTCLHCERERMIPRSRAVCGDGRYCDRACGDAARRGEGHPHAGTLDATDRPACPDAVRRAPGRTAPPWGAPAHAGRSHRSHHGVIHRTGCPSSARWGTGPGLHDLEQG